MSNWIENELTITKGDPAVLWDAIRGDNSPFDFNRLIPMPEGLKNVPCGSQATLAYEYVTGKDIMADYSRYPWVQQAGVTTPEELFAYKCKQYGVCDPTWELDEMVKVGKLLAENERTYGQKDWYDWAGVNWGTPQNAWFDPSYDKKTDNHLSVTTAWAPPMPVIKKLFAMLPEHECKFSWWDTSNSCGEEMVIRGGEVFECLPTKRICMNPSCNEEENEWVRDHEWYCAKHAVEWKESHFRASGGMIPAEGR
jgi:hypothetical protein